MGKSKGTAYGKKVKGLRLRGYSKEGSRFWATSITKYVPKGQTKKQRKRK